jgi:hypothetical protein
MSSDFRLTTEDMRRVEEAVRRHPLPPFVTGFEVGYGNDYDGDPACWITFKLVPNDWSPEQRVEALRKLMDAVRPDLMQVLQDRWPYFHFMSDLSEAAVG